MGVLFKLLNFNTLTVFYTIFLSLHNVFLKIFFNSSCQVYSNAEFMHLLPLIKFTFKYGILFIVKEVGFKF